MTEQTHSAQDLVLYEVRGHIAIITLNRPQKRNAFNAELVRALRGALEQVDGDPNIRVAVIHGAGSAFSSGADVAARQMRTPEEFRRLGGPQEPDAHSGDLLIRTVNWKPVIAAVHGHVMGLGLGLAFECDLVIAEEGCQFQLTETPRGLGGARFWSLLHFCGAAAFGTEIALTGRFFSAAEGKAAGIITRVTQKGQVLDTSLEVARQIAANPPLSVQSTVRTRRWFMDNVERQTVALVDPLKLYLTDDFREAVRAHNEKRPPKFIGQ